jgi:uncharacterized membrane protein YjgN (DUF898 family)
MPDSQLQAARPSAKSAKGVPINVTYVTRQGLVSLSIINFVLNLITLSIYRFWAKTNVRRHIWSCVYINGEPLEYTGTGKELFLGALVVFLLLILPLVILAVGATLWLGPEHPAAAVLQVAFMILVLLLTGMAIYRARRYRLTRTLWRGIRGTLVGSAWQYSLLYFGSLLLKALTLGWSTPAMNTELQQRITRDMRFGDVPFTFRGSAGPLYPAYALCWFGAIVALIIGLALGGSALWSLYYGEFEGALGQGGDKETSGAVLLVLGLLAAGIGIYLVYGMVWSVYQAKEMNAFASYAGFDQAQFRLKATASSLIGLWIGNVAIFIFTIGIGWPFILQRRLRYFCDRLSVEGTVDIGSIRQSKEPIGKRGEGLADAFNIDGF